MPPAESRGLLSFGLLTQAIAAPAGTVKRAAGAAYTSEVEYEWDPEKARRNYEKHGVSFAEASTVFLDPLQVTVVDERHSIGEIRFRTIGYTVTNRLIIVAHTDRQDRIRIITAREATVRERRHYEQQP